MKGSDISDIRELIRARLGILKHIKKTFRWATLLLFASLSISSIVKWLILAPYLDELYKQLLSGGQISFEIPILIKFSLVLVVLCNFLVIPSMIILAVGLGRIIKIRYLMLLDISRLLMLFCVIASIFGVFLWSYFAYAFFVGNLDVLANLVEAIRRYDSASKMIFSVAIILFSYNFIRFRHIIKGVIKERLAIFYIFFVLNILSLLELILIIPFLFYISFRSRSIYLFAYTDIKISKA